MSACIRVPQRMLPGAELTLKTAVEDALRLRGGFESRRWV